MERIRGGLHLFGRLHFDAMEPRRSRTQVNRLDCHITQGDNKSQERTREEQEERSMKKKRGRGGGKEEKEEDEGDEDEKKEKERERRRQQRAQIKEEVRKVSRVVFDTKG